MTYPSVLATAATTVNDVNDYHIIIIMTLIRSFEYNSIHGWYRKRPVAVTRTVRINNKCRSDCRYTVFKLRRWKHACKNQQA